jgi:hypothetical protein
MTLRLSPVTGCGPYFDRLIEDGRLSLGQKTDAVKTLGVVLKNLVDPVKSQDPKYRKLKLGNVKLQAKLFHIPCMMELLTYLGFEQKIEDGENYLVIMSTNDERYQMCFQQDIPTTQTRLTALATNSNSNYNCIAKIPEKLSEKQKARKLLEEKERQEKLKAKENRKRNLAMLKQDKLTRQSDPNWKPKVSAACAKAGTGISTFRDKYGE